MVDLIPPPGEVLMDRPPSTSSIYLRAMVRAPGRRQGAIRPDLGGRVPAVRVAQRGVPVDAKRVALFRAACGDDRRDPGKAPVAFVETLFIGLMAEGVLGRDFPVSPFGLVQIRQTMVERGPIIVGSRLDLVSRLSALRETDRGWEIDFAMEARAEGRGGDPLWEGTATLLSRNAATRARRGSPAGRGALATAGDDGKASTRIVDVPGDTGRRYAAASGDYNPHHLYPITARLVGYRRPIAHGMWTLARTIAVAGEEGLAAEGVRVEASFKRPVFMPGRIRIGLEAGDGGAVGFLVTDPRDGRPHLSGRIAVPDGGG